MEQTEKQNEVLTDENLDEVTGGKFNTTGVKAPVPPVADENNQAAELKVMFI